MSKKPLIDRLKDLADKEAISERDRWKREALAARNLISNVGVPIFRGDSLTFMQDANEYTQARASNEGTPNAK